MCKKPIITDNGQHACGYCIECLIQRSQMWAFRVQKESSYSKTGCFVTLTYSEENVPYVDAVYKKDPEKGVVKIRELDNPVQTLVKSDLQKWFKRVRKLDSKYQKPAMRYFACGEYGGETNRPHYHALVFNLNKKTIKQLKATWKEGFIVVGDVTTKSIHYVTDYMQKKHYRHLDGQFKSFTTMSLKPALGYQYVDENKDNHIFHESIDLKQPKKHEQIMYPYYFKKIHGDNEELKKERVARFEALRDKINKQAEEIDQLDPKGVIQRSKEYQEEKRNRKQKRKQI